MSSQAEMLAVLGVGHLASIRSAEGLSLRDALSRVRYLDVRPSIGAAELQALVARQPSLVEEWDLYSADKRTTGGWYLNAARCEMGQVERPDSIERFGTVEEAVAEYVLRELDFWAQVALPPNKSFERTREG
jgi:hypothetical protein